MKTYKIHALPLCTIDIDMAVLTYRFNYGKKIRMPLISWYIEGAEKKILVDTAANAKLAAEFRGFPAQEVMSFEKALASVGTKPEDIDIVIGTHLQWDHSANTQKCRNAKVLVQEEELRFAYCAHPILAPTYKKSLFMGVNFVVVKGNYEVAPGIDLIFTPGHTPGAQSVVVNTSQGKAVITGFCCLKENFGPPEDAPDEIKEVTPVISPGIHINAKDAFESILLVKGIADIPLPCHDPAYSKPLVIP